MTIEIRAATEDGLWVLGEEDPCRELEGREVRSLADGTEERWALVDDVELWRQRPGEEWEHVATSEDLELRCLLPLRGAVLVGTEEAHLRRFAGDGLEPVTSFDSAPTRDDWFTPWGGPPNVRSMAVDGEGALFVNVHVGGILRSRDDGASWEPTLDLGNDVHEVLAVPGRPGRLLAAAAVGLAESTDSGDTWAIENDGLHSTYCRAVAVAGDTILFSASDGPHGPHAALYRRPLDGDRFERSTSGLPDWFDDNIDTACVATSGDLAAFGSRDGRLFLSEDSGANWRLLRANLPRIHAVSL